MTVNDLHSMIRKECFNKTMFDKVLADIIQDLLNAVVIQAAEDFRDISVKLLMDPENSDLKREKNKIIRFFLSKDFNAFTRVQGKYILTRLQKEVTDLEKTYGFVKTVRAVLLLKAEKAAEIFLQNGKVPAEAEERIRLILSQLQEMQKDLPYYAKQLLTVPRYEDLMAEALKAKVGERNEQ